MSNITELTAASIQLESARTNAWLGLGSELPSVSNAAQALKFGRLSGWNLRKQPIFTRVGNLELMVPDRYAVIRDNPITDGQVDVLGDVGRAYKVTQMEQLAALLDALQQQSGATFDCTGSMDGGRRVFVTMKLPGAAKVGTDQVENYIAVVTSHDGNSSTWIMVTPVRVRNQATLNLAWKRREYAYKVRHTTGADKVLQQQVHDALEFVFNYLDAFQEQAAQLLATPLTQGRFEEIISRNFGAPKGAAGPTITRTQNKLDQMAELYSDWFASKAPTAWGGLSALAEWADHYSPVRPGDDTEDQARSRKALFDPSFKNDALKLMLAEVKK